MQNINHQNKHAQIVAKTLQANGHEAFFAGGCVRDLLLNKEPKDYDIATSALPDDIEELFDKTNNIGKKYGTIIVQINDSSIEVTTFRSDGDYVDGRHPKDIAFSSAEIDAHRRDFTINGLFMNPNTLEITDYIGGQKDLKKRIIQSIGDPDIRFNEDYLRMLRAVRFVHTLDFDFESNTYNSIKRNADKILKISPERIENELSRILIESKRPGDALQTLNDIGLLKYILPEVEKLIGVNQPPIYHPEGDVFTHVKLMLNLSKESEICSDFTRRELVYSILLHDISKPETYIEEKQDDGSMRIRFIGHEIKGSEVANEILSRLKVSNKEKDKIVNAIANHMLPFQSKSMKSSTLKKLLSSYNFNLILELHRLDGLGSKGLLDSYVFLNQLRKQYKGEIILPKSFLNGDDLIKIGINKSPLIGKILKEVYELQLDELITSYDDALEYVKRKYLQL